MCPPPSLVGPKRTEKFFNQENNVLVTTNRPEGGSLRSIRRVVVKESLCVYRRFGCFIVVWWPSSAGGEGSGATD